MVGLKQVIDSSGLFSSAFLDGMIANCFDKANSTGICLACERKQVPLAVAYCVPEKFAPGTYNLLAIGVARNAQRTGIATRMMAYLEEELRRKKGRILLVETSTDPAQLSARKFY